ncbi:MarR family winged helix-turn-helix transcriptional regulator [Halomonas beimenensis]|uniref:HTH marR-type domain-containing protein n=1 Tax=Halomonas beimenensis TaxID=475662 RepID=A0A291P595_9GAMM|nr:MarR family winged helix-turn-helix transcriptional regulator [Halomonas beimenensis]ATJ82028.1 hypothetical protein BEI_1041 [Halomonas beimenensis]
MTAAASYNRIAIKRLFRALEELREVYSDMQLQTAQVFLIIAMNQGITIKELMRRTGLAQSSCSRNVNLLSDWVKPEVPGHGLVVTSEDPKERRRKVVHLTSKGKELAAILSDIVH